MSDEKKLFRFFNQKHNLNNNRWEPEADELAVYFNAVDLKGLLTKTLRVPSGTVARVLMDNEVKLLDEGEHNMETFWQRLNSLFQGKHGEVLITRRAALAVPFEFSGIRSSELLEIDVNTRLMVQVGDVQAFRNHFMRQPGSVTVAQLQQLLGPAVRQIVEEFCNARSWKELSGDTTLRAKLAGAIDSGLRRHFNEYGLDFAGAQTLTLTHEKTYSEKEWDEIKRQEEALRLRYRRGELNVEEAEKAHALRARELDLLEKITGATTREDAIKRGGREAIEALEHDYVQKRHDRERNVLKNRWVAEDEASEWRHLQELAAIRRDGAARVARESRDTAEALERDRIANTVEKLRIQARIEQARLIDDEMQRKAEMQAQIELLAKATQRDEGLKDARHQADLDAVLLASETRRLEAARVQAWDDAHLEARIAELRVRTANDLADGKLSRLERLVALDRADEDATLERRLREEREKSRIASEKADGDLKRDLKTRKTVRKDQRDAREHEIRKATVFGALPPEALLALADSPEKVAALVQVALTREHAGMEPEQISASLSGRASSAASGAASAGMSSQQLADAFAAALTPTLGKMLDAKQTNDAQMWDRFERLHEGALATVKEVAGMVRDSGVGVAQAGRPQVQPAPQPVPQTQPASATPEFAQAPMQSGPLSLKNCPRCRMANMASANYCSACAYQLT